MNIIGIIPARYASIRFPGKPLADILGKTMIQRVYEQCKKSKLLTDVYVATDDDRIFKVINDFEGNVLSTKTTHRNGTERCNEALHLLEIAYPNLDYIINIQGDEPLISPQQIDDLCQLLIDKKPPLATMVRPITNEDEINSPNVVKCVRSISGKAMYFSRHAIPFARNQRNTVFQHVGIYAYKTNILKEIVQLKPTELEQTESLEQLRWLENDYQIQTTITSEPTFGVDSPEDIALIIDQLNKAENQYE